MKAAPSHIVNVTGRKWLTAQTFEIRFSRPADLVFRPGQKIGFISGDLTREYTLLNAPEDLELAICARHIPQGRFSPLLADARLGDAFQITNPFGFFSFKPSPRPAICIATGTGIAPFVAFCRSGVRNIVLLHGVRWIEELYYRHELSSCVQSYRPCLSGANQSLQDSMRFFRGRVTDYLENAFPAGVYDFYVCGRTEMIRDVTRMIDRRFNGSFMFAETFF